MGSERRVHERIYFSRSEEVTVALSLPGNKNKTLAAKIINLSKGGMAISFRRANDFCITQGETLFIKEIDGTYELKCIENILVETVWVLDNASLETIGVGCKFKDLSEENTNCIIQFIAQLTTGNTG